MCLDSFVSHKTGLAGGLLVSVSLMETKHLDFQRFFQVSFRFRPEVGAPQEIVLRMSPDHNLVGAILEILNQSGVRVEIHGVPVRLFIILLFSVPADPTFGAPRNKEMETKHPDK